MPAVRCLAGPPRLAEAPGGAVLRADTTASLLDLLEASGAVTGLAQRLAVLALADRLRPACEGLSERLASVAAPDARARLGHAFARALCAARVGPAVAVTGAELALLEGLRRWALRHMADAEIARFGELVDALDRDAGEPADAPDLAPFLAAPAPQPRPVDPPPPPPAEEAPADPAPAPQPQPAPN